MIPSGEWVCKVTGQAGEAVLVHVGPDAGSRFTDPVTGEVHYVDALKRPARGLVLRRVPTAEEREAQAGARAKRNCRQWARANRLRYLWTFTYAEACRDWQRVRADVTAFQKHLSRVVYPKYGRLPLLFVVEVHPEGHGFHVHVGSPRFIPAKKYLLPGWRGGLMLLGKRADGASVGRRGRTTVGNCSRYLAKYVAKDVGAEAGATVERPPAGRHRYWVTQGFKPKPRVERCETRSEAYALAVSWMGEDAEWFFDSSKLKDWTGPSCMWLRFREGAQWPAPKATVRTATKVA